MVVSHNEYAEAPWDIEDAFIPTATVPPLPSDAQENDIYRDLIFLTQFLRRTKSNGNFSLQMQSIYL